jgi:hypothetical protein
VKNFVKGPPTNDSIPHASEARPRELVKHRALAKLESLSPSVQLRFRCKYGSHGTRLYRGAPPRAPLAELTKTTKMRRKDMALVCSIVTGCSIGVRPWLRMARLRQLVQHNKPDETG